MRKRTVEKQQQEGESGLKIEEGAERGDVRFKIFFEKKMAFQK